MFKLLSVLLTYYMIVNVTEANGETIEYICEPKLSDIKTNEPISGLTEYCKDLKRPCVPKCCKLDEISYTKKIKNGSKTTLLPPVCTSFSGLDTNEVNYAELVIYNASLELGIRKTEKNFLYDYNLVYNQLLENKECGGLWDLSDGYLLEDGKFASFVDMEGIGWYKLEQEYFCVDLNVVEGDNDTQVVFYTANELPRDNYTKRLFAGIALLISSVFFVLVFLVDSVLPERQNLAGMFRMAYVATQCFTFVLDSMLNLFASQLTSVQICNVVKMFYFGFLSSFCWLNIMSFHIWWVLRKQQMPQNTNRRKELIKFGRYCLYGWGVPLGVTIIAILIDNTPNLPAYIIKPKFDDSFRNESVKYYLHCPIGVITLINFVFFSMTAHYMYMTKKDVDTLNESIMKIRLRTYIKISLLMGVSWLIELGAMLYQPELPTWAYILVNFYNAFIGVVVFFMFVANRDTITKLCKRFNYQCSFLKNKKLNRSTKPYNTDRASQSTGATGFVSQVEMKKLDDKC